MPFVGSLDPRTEAIAKDIVDSAFKIHTMYGPGLLESVYEECLALELAKRGHLVERQVAIPIFYEGVQLATPLRLDLLVDKTVLIEVKSIDKVISIHKSQCLTYLKLSKKKLCMLINFNVEYIRDGIERVVL